MGFCSRVKASTFLLPLLVVLIFAVFYAKPANAAINQQINFQGKLTNPDGTNVNNGTYSIVFSIYTVSSGGSAVWTETQGSVSVTDGIFRVALGSVTSLPGSVDFNSNSLYLGIKVGADAEMTPRVQFTAAPYAFNSDTLDGKDSSQFVQLAQGLQVDSSASNSSIAINKTGTAGIMQLQSNGTDVLTISNTGAYVYSLSSGNNPGYSITNNGSSNVVTNLAGTGNFVVQDAGTAFATFAADGSITFAPTGTSDVVINQAAGVGTQINATAAPTVDQLAISNSGQPVTTAGVNGLSITYVGGAANVEASGARIDFTPGSTSGGIWNGMKIVANATGAVAGVTEYGINLDGPTTPGAGAEVAIAIDAKWDAGIQIESQSAEPPTPPASNIYVYAGKYAGRSILSQKGPSGVAYAYQPSLFQSAITFNGPNTGTTTTSFGTAYAVDTTASHPAATETYGYATNFATAATTNDTSGISQTNVQMFRGSVTGGANGFFVVTRVGFPDAGYGAGATGTRFWTGLTNQTAANSTGADNANGHYAGFMYSTNRGDANFQFTTKDNTTQNLIDTGLAFTVAKVYDFYIYTPPLGTTIYWRVDNLTDGTTQEGSTTANLPGATTAMRSVTSIRTLSNTARNIRVAKTYTEADR